MIRINLYKKETIDMNLLIGSYQHEKFNMPFYNTNITLWKGVDNTIEFSIRNHDRKAEKIPEGCKLVFTAINNDLQQIIQKDLDTVNANTGRYSVTITKYELNDYDNAIFTGHVSIVDDDGNEDLLYSGVDWLPNFDVEIKPNKLELIEKSEILNEESYNKEVITDKETGKTFEVFTSSAMKSDVTEYHTFMLKLKDFLGTVKIQGSCTETAKDTPTNWFNIDVITYKMEDIDSDIFEEDGRDINCKCKYCKCDDGSEIIVDEPFTGNLIKAYNLNCLWVRIKYIREIGYESSIEEVYYRN